MNAIALLFALAASLPQLTGLWVARRNFGPDVRGPLVIDHGRASIAGREADVKISGENVSFALPDGEGSFRGIIRGTSIEGHWIQPPGVETGTPFATPVTLARKSPTVWEGVVTPIDDQMTLFLTISEKGSFIVNPERNVGRFLDVQKVVLEGGTYDKENDTISVPIPSIGGTYDFHRTRPAVLPAYVYRQPVARDDAWPVGTLDGAGIDRARITDLVNRIRATPLDSIHASQIHTLLIARHGKLVLDEAFHGTNPDAPHTTRSASKSLTSVLIGAAKLPISTPVYATMGVPTDDPRKKAMTVEHLLTQSSGLDCDDDDEHSPGNEDVMQSQTAQPDWYRYTLDLKNIRKPGEKSVYCSCQPNLAGGVLGRVTGRWLPDLFRELVAEPLQMREYGLNLMPTGDAYMGGGARFRARDFLKLGQLMLDGGRWHGRQIVSAAWAKQSTSPQTTIGESRYGFLWWIGDYPYRGRSVRGFFAAGNGGQVVLVIPELDLVIGFFGGNYSDRAARLPLGVIVPQDILPAVQEDRSR
jgi:CubicO group peptidase (beta-lactamase class C family)